MKNDLLLQTNIDVENLKLTNDFSLLKEIINNKNTHPNFITVEGVDGAGKSTQIKLMKKQLEKMGYKVCVTREPSDTSFGKKIRKLTKENDTSPIVDMLLFTAARVEHCEKIIIPALEEGKIVICDRYIDSTIAYQCQSEKELEVFNRLNIEELPRPSLTFYLDLTAEESLRRQKLRFEQKIDLDVNLLDIVGVVGESSIKKDKFEPQNDEKNLDELRRRIEIYKKISTSDELNRFISIKTDENSVPEEVGKVIAKELEKRFKVKLIGKASNIFDSFKSIFEGRFFSTSH